MLPVTGVGSGLDIESLVTQLIRSERAPAENRLLAREAQFSSELSAFGTFKGALATFQSKLTNLSDATKFSQRTATSTDKDVVSASASTTAASGSYDVSVNQLAKAQSLASTGYTALTAPVGEGTLSLRFGTTDYTAADPGPESYDGFTVNPDRAGVDIIIDSSNNSLEGVRDAINAADAGVSAAIVNDGGGYRLLLSSSDSGVANSLEISVADAGDGNNTDAIGLSALAFNADASHLSQSVAAQDALYSINGLALHSSSNTVTGAVDGVDLTFHEISSGAPVTVSVAEDRASVKTAINEFVSGYNALTGTINSLTSYDAGSGTAGPLQGDFSARTISSRLRNVLVGEVAGIDGAFSTLAEIGITTSKDGTLSLDAAKLDKQLEASFDSIAKLFTAGGYSKDPGLSVEGLGAKTQAGSYDVNITQYASGPRLDGAAIGFPLVVTDANDNFTLSVDGVDSGPIAISQLAFTDGASLAADIQARINEDSALAAAGIAISVSFNGDHLEFTSGSIGSAATIAITSVDPDGASTLGLSIASAAGLDIAGTIGGFAATGTGNTLKGAAGSPVEGFRIALSAGSTGARGSVHITQGLAQQLDDLLTGFLDTDGVLDARVDGLQERVDDITSQRERLDLRMVAVEARYRSQFNALDTLMSQLQTTSSFLTEQLASLPKIGSSNN